MDGALLLGQCGHSSCGNFTMNYRGGGDLAVFQCEKDEEEKT